MALTTFTEVNRVSKKLIKKRVMQLLSTAKLTIADQVWIATALLHREQPERTGFRPVEIIDRIRVEFGSVRSGHHTHISQHCVANKSPSPNALRMLSQEPDGTYRLFKPGDAFHPDRELGRSLPKELPPEYHHLLDWYEREYAGVFQFKVFGPDAVLLRLRPFDSGLSDISERHDEYLAEGLLAKWREQQQAKPADGSETA